MNKKLIALAVAGACVASDALAQTANPVTLYGRVYLTAEAVEAKGGSTNVSRRSRIEDQASLLGVRGTEDLGGGLKAFFQLETAFKPDAAVSPPGFANRNSGIGLQGGFGSVLFGRWDMPFKSATITIDPYGDLTNSGITGVLSGSRASGRAVFDKRANNIVQYWSPTMGGLAFRGAIGTSDDKTDGAGGRTPRDLGANVTFTRGPVYVFGAWEEHRDVAVGVDEDALAVGGSMAFGPIKVGAQYQRIDRDGARKAKNVMLNGVWTMGKNQFIAQIMTQKDGGPNSLAVQPDCDSWSVAYQYNFTRRTFFIASYVEVDNNATSDCNFGANRLGITPGNGLAGPTGTRSPDLKSAWAGLRHVF